MEAALLTKINNRWTTRRVAEMSNGSAYTEGAAADQDRLQQAVDSAADWVKQRCGPVDDDDNRVIEAVPIFLLQYGADPKPGIDAWEMKFGKMAVPVAVPKTTAIAAGDTDDRRRYSGEDFMDDGAAFNQRSDRVPRNP